MEKFRPESASSILPSFLLPKFLEKLAPSEKFHSVGKEKARPGGGIMENRWERSGENYIFCINFVDFNIMHCDLRSRNFVQKSCTQAFWQKSGNDRAFFLVGCVKKSRSARF